jgi:hypothetical protein
MRPIRTCFTIAALAGTALAGGAAIDPATAQNAAFALVSPDEASASSGALMAHGGAGMIEPKAFDPMAPQIVVISPKIDHPTHPPLDVRVEAHTRANLAVNRASLKVRYGFFRVDVTDRLVKYGQWQGNAFVVTGADVPAGDHMFYVSIADSSGHEGQATMKVTVLPN